EARTARSVIRSRHHEAGRSQEGHIVPRLGQYQWILDMAFFLYPSEPEAARGDKAGGTGFLVTLPSIKTPETYEHVYGVTNRHVAETDSVIRINRHSGPPTIIELSPDDWHSIPNGHDVAVASLQQLSPATHKAQALAVASFLTER